jgi:hypothetical protein
MQAALIIAILLVNGFTQMGRPLVRAASFTCCSVEQPQCEASNDASECEALGALFAATAGHAWENSAGWEAASAGNATDYCSFYGVSCSATGFIHAMYAAPPSRIEFSRVADVWLARSSSLSLNKLAGSVPKELGNLTMLTLL